MKGNRTPSIAVIAGTGVAELFEVGPRIALKTRFGRTEAFKSKTGGFYLLPRHGPGHTFPPHMINYRANAVGLSGLGVKDVIATSAVGSMNPEFMVGGLGLAEQFLDFTKSRESTLFDKKVVHTDMTEPYSRELNAAIARASTSLGVGVKEGLTYVSVEGPRFETAAEIKMFRKLGGDVVGMTGVPEVVLSREAGMRYSAILIATNWAAGMQKKVSHEEVVSVMKRSGQLVKSVIEGTVNDLQQRPIHGETIRPR
jgi:5'-methylthioadenosine phosphorylase